MPEQEQEIKDRQRRVETAMLVFPKLTEQQATNLDRLLVPKIDEVLGMLADLELEGVDKQVVASLGLMYLKSNVDNIFAEAHGVPAV